jgi:hypothetical protein
MDVRDVPRIIFEEISEEFGRGNNGEDLQIGHKVYRVRQLHPKSGGCIGFISHEALKPFGQKTLDAPRTQFFLWPWTIETIRNFEPEMIESLPDAQPIIIISAGWRKADDGSGSREEDVVIMLGGGWSNPNRPGIKLVPRIISRYVRLYRQTKRRSV